MRSIWAPWRIQYIRMEKPKGCFLCDTPRQKEDAITYVLYRGKQNYIVMNSFPYNPAHLLVAPYRHVASPEDLSKDELLEHFELVNRCLHVLKEAYQPGGFNIGMNLGKVAGAGVDDHVHTHIVPRWQGDTNFMPVLADVRIMSEALSQVYQELKGKF